MSVSALEKSQNRQLQQLTFDQLDNKLRMLMHGIHDPRLSEGRAAGKSALVDCARLQVLV
ncbi:MAG: hypothetical protein AB8B57_06280 [Congregibacter sp.]